MGLHVVVGKGAIGTTLSGLLAERGDRVKVVSRSGGEDEAGVEHVAVDVAHAPSFLEAAGGAHVIYNCVNPPYHRWPTDWPPLHRSMLAASEDSGAVYVIASNLYGYGRGSGVMSEAKPLAPTETKGRVRTEMWEEARTLHLAGRVRTVEVRASDYFGPIATGQAHYGSRFFLPILERKTLRPVGSADQPHAVTYLPDLARAMAAAGGDEAAWGKAWIAPIGPAVTFRQRVSDVAAAAGLATPKIQPVPPPSSPPSAWSPRRCGRSVGSPTSSPSRSSSTQASRNRSSGSPRLLGKKRSTRQSPGGGLGSARSAPWPELPSPGRQSGRPFPTLCPNGPDSLSEVGASRLSCFAHPRAFCI